MDLQSRIAKIIRFLDHYVVFKTLKIVQLFYAIYIVAVTFTEIAALGVFGGGKDPQTSIIIDVNSEENAKNGIIDYNVDGRTFTRAIVEADTAQMVLLALLRMSAFLMYPAIVCVLWSKYRAMHPCSSSASSSPRMPSWITRGSILKQKCWNWCGRNRRRLISRSTRKPLTASYSTTVPFKWPRITCFVASPRPLVNSITHSSPKSSTTTTTSPTTRGSSIRDYYMMNEQVEEEASTSLPQSPSPTAKAFFDALDGKNQSCVTRTLSSSLQRKLQSTGWRNRHSQSDQYPMEIAGHKFSVQQVQRGEVEGTYGTGATVWPAALVLCKYLEKHPHLVEHKRVMDLGSGTAVTSIAAAILGAAQVCCTDGDDSVVELANGNVQQATITDCPINVIKYWWGNEPPSIERNCGTGRHAYDLILVADCVLPKLYPMAPLVQALDDCLVNQQQEGTASNSGKSCAILSYEHRWYPDYNPKDKFIELCQERNLVVETVQLKDLDSIYQTDDIEIWEVTRQYERNNSHA